MTKYAKQLKRKSTIVGLRYEHVPNSEADLMGVNVKINSVGLRDYEYPFEKNDSRREKFYSLYEWNDLVLAKMEYK